MRNVQDQLDKGLLQNWLPLAGLTQIDYPVTGQKQEADVWFEPAPARVAERKRLGALGRMVGRGPCLLEPFSQAPGVFAVEDCVRKQLVLGYGRAMEARTARPRRNRPARPHLWILAAGEPGRVLREYELRPMAGWPAGFWTHAPMDRLHIVVQSSLLGQLGQRFGALPEPARAHPGRQHRGARAHGPACAHGPDPRRRARPH